MFTWNIQMLSRQSDPIEENGGNAIPLHDLVMLGFMMHDQDRNGTPWLHPLDVNTKS